jgi:hypothetical protein
MGRGGVGKAYHFTYAMTADKPQYRYHATCLYSAHAYLQLQSYTAVPPTGAWPCP